MYPSEKQNVNGSTFKYVLAMEQSQNLQEYLERVYEGESCSPIHRLFMTRREFQFNMVKARGMVDQSSLHSLHNLNYKSTKQIKL